MGDQFALMEAVISLAVALRRFDFRMVPGHDPGMTTGTHHLHHLAFWLHSFGTHLSAGNPKSLCLTRCYNEGTDGTVDAGSCGCVLHLGCFGIEA